MVINVFGEVIVEEGGTYVANQTITQIANSEESGVIDSLLDQGIASVGIVVAASLAAFFVWLQNRKIPPLGEQERIFQEIAKEVLYSRYLILWKEIIEDVQKDPKKIREYWEDIGKKRLPLECTISIYSDTMKFLKEFVKERKFQFAASDEKMKERLEDITRIVLLQYAKRNELMIGSLVETAVGATLDSNVKNTDNIVELVNSSLEKLKILMIFNRVVEDEQVLRIMIGSEINKKIREYNN